MCSAKKPPAPKASDVKVANPAPAMEETAATYERGSNNETVTNTTGDVTAGERVSETATSYVRGGDKGAEGGGQRSKFRVNYDPNRGMEVEEQGDPTHAAAREKLYKMSQETASPLLQALTFMASKGEAFGAKVGSGQQIRNKKSLEAMKAKYR